MMRKILTFLCAALMSVGMWAAPANSCGPNLTWNLSGGVLTISGTGAMTNWSFESKAPWYFDRSDITSVTIGNGVTSIGNFAFFDCTDMTSVTIGNSVTSIGEAAFQSCSGLTSITIPSSVTSIGKSAFAQCGLTSITIPNSVTSIGEGAFNQCFGLTSITIPNSVTSIGTGAFAACLGLTSMEVASGNTNYDSRDNCKAIIEKSSNTLIAGCKNTIIPNSVTSIGIGAFFGCFSLESITIPTSVTSIGQMAFQFCYGLTSITIPNSVTSIGESAFAGCALTSVTIGNSVTSIGKGAFAECSNLTSIEIPNSVTSIGQSAFSYCEGLTSVTIGNSVTSIGQEAFSGCSGLTSIEIPNSVTSIGQQAFSGCSRLETVTILAESLESYGSGAFDDTHADLKIYVPAGSVNTYKTEWAAYEDKIVAAPEKETIIFSNFGLDNAYDLTTGPLTVGNIELNFDKADGSNPPAFYTTGGGTARIYKGNTMSISAGGATITKIVFNLTQGTPTFDTGSYNATTSTWEGEATTLTLSNEMASGQVRIVSMDVYYSVASAANPSGSCGANLSWEFDPSNGTLTITGTGAMDNYDGESTYAPWINSYESITSVIISNGVTSIGDYAFLMCSSLASIEIPNSVTSIGFGAFFMCSSLASIEIPNSVTSIGEAAFADCSNLETVTVNATTPPTLGTDAFAGTAEGLKIYVPARSVDDYKAAWAAYADKITTPTYTVTLQEGTEDADNWTITPPEAKTTGVAEGTEVTATYSGTKLVKSVKAVKKAPAPTSLTITDGYEFSTLLDIAGCTTWDEVIAKNSDKIKKVDEGYITDSTGQYGLLKGKNTAVKADDLFDPNATDYKWVESN